MALDPIEVSGQGMGAGEPPAPCVIVIFGASGDLTHRELVPAFYELACQQLLPKQYAIVGFARSDWTDDEFRERMRDAVAQECDFDGATWKTFAPRLHYLPGDFRSAPEDDYAALNGTIRQIQRDLDLPDHVLFHLATPPGFFAEIVERLEAGGLAHSDTGWRRLVIEKPFGEDRTSARQLDARLRAVFDETQIYRIDHFLGKETVQNMLVFRFANPAFEPIWNRTFIDHVQITVAESIGIGSRAGFYEKIGVARDMLQNHLLQLLCMTAIDPPVRFDGASLRDETVKVLRSVQRVDVDHDCVRGQYDAGTVDGEEVRGYREEEDVAPRSMTPTFGAVKLQLDNWRWSGVPFYLRTGKRLPRKLTEVAIHFKPTPHLMFQIAPDQLHRNVLAFRLQPEEGIFQTFAAKQPGPGLTIDSVHTSFLYADAFGLQQLPRAYAWLLLDAMQGDQTLFARADWIDRAWEIVDPIVERWEATAPLDFPNYAAGTWGPAEAQELLRRDGREWSVV